MSSKLKATTLEDLLKRPFPYRETLLSPWFYSRQSVLVWAAPGVGKTFFSLSLALAMAGGGEFLGWKSPQCRRVLIVDGEMDLQDLRDRLCGLLPGVPGLDQKAAASNITILARQDQKPDALFPDIATEAGQEIVLERAKRGKFDVLILDNYSTLADVADENSAAAMGPVLHFLLKLKQARIATILVHHSNKTGESFRGSSKLAATFEVILGLTRSEEAILQKGGVCFKLMWEKYRGKRDDTTQNLIVSLPTAGDKVLRWVFNQSDDAPCDKLLALLKTGDYITQDELADAMQVSKGQVAKLKVKLHNSGRCDASEFTRMLNGARVCREEQDVSAPDGTSLTAPSAEGEEF